MSSRSEVRYEVKTRAKFKSELSLRADRPLECCHLNHDKNDPDYNSPDTLVYCTDIEHLAYHLLFRSRSKLTGLNSNHNEYAIRTLLDRAIKYNEDNNLNVDILSEIDKATTFWFYYLGIEA